MNIYRIEIQKYGYDSNNAHVIVANNEKEVIELAAKNACDEGKDIWADESSIILLGKAIPIFKFPEVLLTSFNAG